MVLLQRSDLLFHLQPPLHVLLHLQWINLLDELEALPLDLMELIELGELGRVDAVVTEVTVEQDASLLQRSARPRHQCVVVFQKGYVLLRQESQAVPLPQGKLPRHLRLPPGLHLGTGELLKS